MAKILVSGLINLETTVQVDGFPIPYSPVEYPFYGIQSSISGVGYNISKALTRLGDDVLFLSLIGKDLAGTMTREALKQDGISDTGVLDIISQTAQSVILYDKKGKRKILVDLKNNQEFKYPHEQFVNEISSCDLCCLCNINFSRPLLQIAQKMQVPIATDVHTVEDLDDAYNREFMQAADILFMSDEKLPSTPEEWVRDLWERYRTGIIVIGMGAKGALLAEYSKQEMRFFPAARLAAVKNTIGAGDALFSAFIHAYLKERNIEEAMQKAILFAGFKISGVSAAEGFLDNQQLEEAFERYHRG